MSPGPQPVALFDRSAALERIGGDEELLREIASLFLEEYPQLIREIRAALERGDAQTLERSSHSLKGAVANFEARAAVHASFRLEAIGRSRDLTGSREALADLEAVFEDLHPILLNLSTE